MIYGCIAGILNFSEMRISEKAVVLENNMRWRVLRRTGNVVLLEGVPENGLGKKRWDVCFINADRDGDESFNSNVNYSNEAESPTFSKNKMEDAFNNAVRQVERSQKAKEALLRADQEKARIEAIWRSEVEDIHAEQAVLVEKMKSLTRGERSVLSNKKIFEIAQKLMVIDCVLHHGRPRG